MGECYRRELTGYKQGRKRRIANHRTLKREYVASGAVGSDRDGNSHGNTTSLRDQAENSTKENT